jgi:hypothetical protein
MKSLIRIGTDSPLNLALSHSVPSQVVCPLHEKLQISIQTVVSSGLWDFIARVSSPL